MITTSPSNLPQSSKLACNILVRIQLTINTTAIVDPKEWSRPDMARNLFTDTVEQCCDNFFKDQPCVHYSRGCQGSVRQQYQAEEGCVIPGWHPVRIFL